MLRHVRKIIIRIRWKQRDYRNSRCRYQNDGNRSRFGAVGTAGQRCTSTRRLIIHESIYDKVKTLWLQLTDN
jgi:hypothetical protein